MPRGLPPSSTVRFGKQFRQHRLHQRRHSVTKNAGSHRLACSRRLGRIGRRPRVAKDQPGEPRRIFPAELQRDVSAHRQPAEDYRLADLQSVQQGRQIVGELLHGGFIAFGGAAAEAGQIGRNHPAMRGKRFDLAGPHRVVQRKPVHQQERQAGAPFETPEVGAIDRKRLHGFFFSSSFLRKKSNWRWIRPEWGSSSAALVCSLTASSRSPLAK
jgi:hypothetical protein